MTGAQTHNIYPISILSSIKNYIAESAASASEHPMLVKRLLDT